MTESSAAVAPVAQGRVGADREAWRSVLADVAVVTVTPFAGSRLERVDHERLGRNLAHLLPGGIRLLVAAGNTGEFASLSPSEVVDVVRTHVRSADGRARVIAGIGYRVEEAVELGRKAIEAGADGLMIHHPIHPYASEPGLLRYYASIAEALPGTPLIPYIRGPQITEAGARELSVIDTIVGVKMGQPEPDRFARLVQAPPDLAWVCGVAEGWAVPFSRAGAVGFTSGIANVAPRLSLEVHAHLLAGDHDRAASAVERLRPIEGLRGRHENANNVSVIKAALDLLGLAGGGLRPPLSSLDATDRSTLERILRDLEVLN